MYNAETIKRDFPIFEHRPELVYLDSAATAQKPRVVLEAMRAYYEEYCANISRGLYPTAEMATVAVEAAREKIAGFIGSEIDYTVFVGSATHAINLVATGWRERLVVGDNIVVTALEHHSNFLPWKEVARKTGATLRIAEPASDGQLTLETLAALVDGQTKLVALSAVSNVIGIANPIEDIIRAIRRKNPSAHILIDACQAVGHIPVSLRAWDADYLVFSGHKVYGPTGIGVLAGKKKSLELLGGTNVGGGTVLDPLTEPTLYKKLPAALEGGTPNIAGIIGLGAAIDFLESLGLDEIQRHERSLIVLAEQRLRATFGDRIHIIGPKESPHRAGILSFALDGIHPHDLAHLLGEEEICIRAGEHCAHPLHRALDLAASARLSVAVYTTTEDIEKCITGIKRALKLFSA